MEKLFIKKLKRTGHLWIFKNEIVSNIDDFASGTLVRIYDEKTGKFFGIGYVNPKSTIAARILSFKEEEIDKEFFRTRILNALNYREKFLGLKNSFRVVYSESDFLPGLIIDKYGDCIVIQILTAGIERFKELLISLIDEIFNPAMIVLKNDSQSRQKEGLPIERKVIKGDSSVLPIINEEGVIFKVDPVGGQKTGFFLDQRENRIFLRQIIKSGNGLDLFCYTGAWSLHLAYSGATVTGVDSSGYALEIARQNATINKLEDKAKFIKADAFDYLKWELKKGNTYDFIVLDPPAFVKSKKEKNDAIQGYLSLNTAAIKLLKKGGILATSSCSQHISEDEFFEVVKEALSKNKKIGKLLYKGTQSKDHPIMISMPETAYLKCLIIKIVD